MGMKAMMMASQRDRENDSAELGTVRFSRRVWLEVASLDVRRAFPVLSADNFESADKFRVARSAELLAAVGLVE